MTIFGPAPAGRLRVSAWLATAMIVAGASCAPRSDRAAVVDVWPSRLQAAEASVVDGCYRCLEIGLREYEAALAAGVDATVAPRAYRVAVHLAVRERLLGLFPGEYQDAPARLAQRALPDDRAAAADVLGVMPWRRGTQTLGMVPSVQSADLPRLRDRRRALEPLAETDAWHAMLLLALVGTNPILGLGDGERPPRGVQPGLDRDTWWRRHPDDAALSFTRLTLLRASLDELAGFREMHPAFVETDAITGEGELARGRLVSADEAFARALEAFPGLVPALALRADIRQRMEDQAVALGLYDRLLERFPEHREALLGRVKTLGFLARHDDAIAAVDRMLALGTWYLGEAHYWKAWNLFSLGRLDDSRVSVDAARPLMVNADLSYLGGAIAFRQQRLDDAHRDFDTAVELESRHCEAHFDRAAVDLTRGAWPVASAGFDEAFECLDARTPTLERRIADAREARLADDVRAALVARREQALRDHHAQLGWARYNAGVAYANSGKPAEARARADEAITIGGPAASAAQRLLPQLPPAQLD
ncbi:putative PEP-CTERM system TPR-repeat lipoprotein [Luteitalea pratensis]|uniref:Putative PEP-CTERM system TPR-repeat lipoprotein n=2 Tax=Luteitalea pratensis TaxID=1855912 RepID=A0A143PN94_LUTPR|nr:putative PEP-CTERM system TPR-repeat lipoprotein [Luteitalea pratensis]